MVTTRSMTKTDRARWPVPLYFFPFDTPYVLSLGCVSSSLLLRKRRRGQGGCLVAIDVNPRSPSGKPDATINKGKVDPDTHQDCKMMARHGRVSRAAVRVLAADQEMERVRPLPPRIRCGHLRSAIRQCFPAEGLSLVQELSIKTSQKLETGVCKFCEEQSKKMLNDWKEERFKAAESVDADHVALFKKALAALVPLGWDRKDYPFVPNGNATCYTSRAQGGNWTDQAFSTRCRATQVWSSGKPRVVTLYGGGNSARLYRLHHALYNTIRKEGWLLVGSPTDELVASLNGDGPFVSVDYQSATDNIRLEYVRASIEVLKAKAARLTTQESEALDVLGNLDLFDEDRVAVSGQPMGSMISFPLLCLVNKVVVDLAVADMASAGKISWKQFRVHRCLINGDDLLYREFDNSRDVLAGILAHGSRVGLVVNKEKTMVSPIYAEINSCAFKYGRKQKKTNVGVLIKRSEVTDPIGFLADSVVKRKTFYSMMLDWVGVVKNAERKLHGPLPPSFWSVLFKREFRHALCSVPSGRPKPTNPFPVVPMPDGYDLSREEEVAAIRCRVERLREQGFTKPRARRGTPSEWKTQCYQHALKRKNPSEETMILKVCADRWVEATKEKLLEADPPDPARYATGLDVAWDERSKVSLMIDAIRWSKSVSGARPRTQGDGTWGEFASLAC